MLDVAWMLLSSSSVAWRDANIFFFSSSSIICRWTTCGRPTCSSWNTKMAATPSPCRASCLLQDIPAARGNTVTLTTSNTCTTQTAAAGTIASRRSRAPAATSSPATAGTTTATRGTGAATVSNRAEAVTGHKTTGAAAATAIIDGGGTDTRHGGGGGLCKDWSSPQISQRRRGNMSLNSALTRSGCLYTIPLRLRTVCLRRCIFLFVNF